MTIRDTVLIVALVVASFFAGFGLGWFQVSQYQREALTDYRRMTCQIVTDLNANLKGKSEAVVEEEKKGRKRP